VRAARPDRPHACSRADARAAGAIPRGQRFDLVEAPADASRRLGVNKLWRMALLTTSRNLRQAVLRGRIWSYAERTISAPGNDDDDDVAKGDADVPPNPGDLELGDEAALAGTPLLDRAGPSDDADTNADARLGVRPRAESLARLEAMHKAHGPAPCAARPAPRATPTRTTLAPMTPAPAPACPCSSIIRARGIFASSAPQAQLSPWSTLAAEERAEEASMATLLAQLGDGDADVDGEEDADVARTLAAKAGARGSRGVRTWEAPDGSGAPLEIVRHVSAAAHATSISRASMRRAGGVAPSVSTLFAPDAVATEEPGPTADIPDIPEDGIIAAAPPDSAEPEATRIAELEADLARSRAQLADMLARLAAVAAHIDAVDAAHVATSAERDVTRVALHERDAVLAARRRASAHCRRWASCRATCCSSGSACARLRRAGGRKLR
jgi:hypothetical protein